MHRTARSLGFVLCAALVATWTAAAHAQVPAPPGYPPPGYSIPPGYAPPLAYLPPMFVDLASTEPGVRVSIYPEKAKPGLAAPIVECASPPCRVGLYPGRYQLHVSEGPDTVAGSRGIEITAPSLVTVDPDTQEHRSVGLALGIAGPVLMLGGIVWALSEQCYDTDNCRNTSDRETRAELAIFTMLAGIAITPIGWVMFGTSYKPEVEVSSGLMASGDRPVRTASPRRREFAAGLRF
jgi:hypothetical protein